MRKRTVKILTGLAILVVALALIYAIWLGISAAKLRSAYAALEKDGRPLQMTDLISPPIADTENAALLYESAVLQLRAIPVSPTALIPRNVTLPTPLPVTSLLRYLGILSVSYTDNIPNPSYRPEFQKQMQSDVVSSALRCVEQGTTRPACRFNNRYDQQGFPLSPDLGYWRGLARILAAKAISEAENGHVDEAWDTAITLLRFADALRTERSYLVSQLVRMDQTAVACKSIRRLCDSSIPSEQECGLLDTLLEGFDDISPLIPAVDAERLEGERIFNLPKDELWRELQTTLFRTPGYQPEIVHRLRFYKLTFKPFFLADHAAYLRLMHGYAKLLEQPYEPGEADRLNKLYDEIVHGHTPHKLTEWLSRGIPSVRREYVRMIADARVTRTGLALLRYREAHGAFPESLDVLGLDYVQDPFSRKPLIYRPELEGFILYSIAQDQQDNDGRPRQPKEYTDYDLVWHFRSHAD